MCIVPGLGFNHGVRGFAKVILSIVGFLGGGFVGLMGILALDQKYHAIWTPILFCAVFAFLLGFLPTFKPALRWGYALLMSGCALTMWMLSRPKMHKDLMDWWFRLGPKVTLLMIVVGLLWFTVAYARQSKRPPLFWIALLLLEAALVGYFSSSIGGKPNTMHILQTLFHLDDDTASWVAYDLRKTLHFLFYGTIGFSGFQLARGSGVTGRAVVFLGIAFGLLYGSFDEMRQSDSAGRQGSIVDVGLDVCGATAFCLVANRKYGEKKKQADS